MTRLTQHFSLEELCYSEVALRHGIANTPGAEIERRLLATAQQMERVRGLLGAPIQVTSGYRCAVVNTLVGGSAGSAHCQGWAVDFQSPFGPPLAVCKAIAASDLAFDQLILEHGAWCHLSFDPRLRGQVLTISHADGAQPGLRP